MKRSRLALILMLCPAIEAEMLRAEDSTLAATPPSAARVTGPASLTAEIGDVTIRIDGPKLWTLSRIEYGGSLLGIEDSAYGTVVNIRDVGILGSAHKIDVPGRPGETEAEEVTRLRFFLDDRPLEVNADTMRVTGKNFRMERESKIRAFALQTTLKVGDNQIRDTVRVRSDQAVDLKVLYPWMYAWTPLATAYLFGTEDGKQKSGAFLDKPANAPRYITEKSVRWAATYDPTSRRGTVSSIVAVPKECEGWLMFSDAPNVYRKLYLVSFSERPVAKGFDGTYSVVTGFYSASADEWKLKAAERAAELQE